MNHEKVQLIRGVELLAVGLLLGSVATTIWADHKGDSKACFETTKLMLKACSADIGDDFLVENAKCLNTNDARACQGEAKADYKEARQDCRYQSEGRNDLCERLPNAGPYIVELDPDDFTGECAGGNPFYPLVPGTVTTFVSEEDAGETIVVAVTDETREIAGIETIVVRDTVYAGLPNGNGDPIGDRIEDTDDYYAVANNCDVWYLGEVSQSFEDGYLDNLHGSFVTDIDRAQAGIIMLADPMVGDVYRQEFALGDAEDAAEILALNTDIYDENGDLVEFDDSSFNCNGACLLTEDFVATKPDAIEFKYFKAGIGFVAEQLPEGEVILKLIKIEVLP